MPCTNMFFDAYVTAALWSSNDESTPEGGKPMEASYGASDIDAETLATMRTDCDRFVGACEAQGLDLDAWEWGRYTSDECAGHDLWLTRNGHGVGFWSRDVPEGLEPLQDELDKLATALGEYSLYVGDDGAVYGSEG